MNGTRISSLLGKITVLVVICCFCLSAQAKYGGGSGTSDYPYLIYDANQMNAIGADANDWDKHFKLMADIDLSGYTGTSFNIIGYWVSSDDYNPFIGVFDGNGHVIKNFTYTSKGGKDLVGVFSYISDPNAEVKNLGLICANVNSTEFHAYDIGSLAGRLKYGTISNCFVEDCNVSGDYAIGGLVGRNLYGTVQDCYSTGTVSGGSGGGLIGRNYGGPVYNCYSTASVFGNHVGGLLAENWHAMISDCYSTGNVEGSWLAGGLVGENNGEIHNCYSRGSVVGNSYAGGLVGKNGSIFVLYSLITNSYSIGLVVGTGDHIGGLVGDNHEGTGEVKYSFWDVNSSTEPDSDGGTGLPTAEMQTMSTFTDSGWDFVCENANGTENIWFIPQGDYPHLWWEGMQVPMKLTPRTLNCRSQGNWAKAHLTLPEGFTVADVDSNRPAVLHSFGFESAPLYVFVNENELVEIEAAFERQALCSTAGDWPDELTVAGFLADGNIFLGTSTVRIIHPGMKVIEDLASCWLNADCVHPTWCDGIDMNRDSLVNLLDYALFMNINVEFVTDE